MVRAARYAGDGLFSARRHQPAAVTPRLHSIGAAHGCSAAAVALAWAIRSGNVIAIPESGSAAHVTENAVALSLTLTPQELQTLDAAHPPPDLYQRVFRQLKHGLRAAARRFGLY